MRPWTIFLPTALLALTVPASAGADPCYEVDCICDWLRDCPPICIDSMHGEGFDKDEGLGEKPPAEFRDGEVVARVYAPGDVRHLKKPGPAPSIGLGTYEVTVRTSPRFLLECVSA